MYIQKQLIFPKKTQHVLIIWPLYNNANTPKCYVILSVLFYLNEVIIDKKSGGSENWAARMGCQIYCARTYASCSSIFNFLFSDLVQFQLYSWCNVCSNAELNLIVIVTGLLAERSGVRFRAWPLTMKPIGCLETSVRSYHYSLRKIPKERRSHLHWGGSLDSRTQTRARARAHTHTHTHTHICIYKGKKR